MKNTSERPLENRCTYCGFSRGAIQVTISSSRVERHLLMTGFAYQALPDSTQGGQCCHIQHHKLLQKGNQRWLMELKACYSSTQALGSCWISTKVCSGRVSSSSLSSLMQSSGRSANPSFPNGDSYCCSQAASWRNSGREANFLYPLAGFCFFLLKIIQQSYDTFEYYTNSRTFSNKIHLDTYLKSAVQHNQTKYKKYFFQ